MSGYKLMYNTPDGGKGSLGLMKNYAFNNSMCDGIYLKQLVPPSTTETELFISQGSVGYDSAGTLLSQSPAMCVYVTKPVDEYITVVINYTFKDVFGSGETVKSSMVFMLQPQQTLTFSNLVIWTAYCTFNDVYIYVGKRLAYKFEGDTECKNFKDTYFGARKVTGDTTENTHKGFPLTCNNETLYVYPLCKDFKIENNGDNEISSIYLPAFRYKDEIYYPTIKISDNKEDVLNKAVGYMPSFIGNAFKEEYSLKDEDISAENTGDLGAGAGLEFDPSDFDFTPPKFEGGIVFPETTFNETTKEIVKESITTAVKDTTIIEARPVENTGGNTGESGGDSESGDSGDTGGSENNNYTIIGADAVQFEVDKSGWGMGKYLLTHDQNNNTDITSSNYIPNDYYPLFDNDGNIKGVIVQIYNEDGSVAATYVKNTDEQGLSGAFKQLVDTIGDMSFGDGTLYKNPDGGFTYIDNAGNITISDGTKGGTSFYEFTGGINNVGHEVYYGPDGFPVYIWTDPDTGEKIIM